MSTPVGSSQWMYTPASGFYPYLIDQSLRFNDNDSAHLTFTPSSAGNRKTWTWSCWVKRSSIDSTNAYILFDASTSDTAAALIEFGKSTEGDNSLNVVSYQGAHNIRLRTSMRFRDVSSWYHIVVAMDTSQATASDRVNIYVNGTLQTDFQIETYPAQNHEPYFNSTNQHHISKWWDSRRFFDGYMAEVNFIDGTALDATSFGETINGIWVPKQYSGSYGTNGFYLSFADSAAIGDDLSGNTNDWTANNLVASDVVSDSPTDNAVTWDYNNRKGVTLSEGNLYFNVGTSQGVCATMPTATTGKWYFEFKVNGAIGLYNPIVWGFSSQEKQTFANYTTNPRDVETSTLSAYTDSSTWQVQAKESGTLTTISPPTAQRPAQNSIIGIAYDADTGKAWMSVNNVWLDSSGGTTGDPSTGANPTHTFTSGIAIFPAAFDVGGVQPQGILQADDDVLTYTPPTDFLTIKSSNLPKPAIGPNSTTTSDQNFNIALYQSNGGLNTITGLGHQPDFLWIKQRDSTNSHAFTDSVRGPTKALSSNLTDSEYTYSNGLQSFDSDGFTLNGNNGWYNSTTVRNYVAWSWKAGGTAASNTDGTITSQVSANTDAGFSIVGFTSTGNTETVGHGLSQAPELYIRKSRSNAENWVNFFTVVDGTLDFMNFNTTNASSGSGASLPTSTVFSIGGGETNGETHIAYCFHSVEGFSKVGSYVGNFNADGPFVYTGFRPAWLMLKRSDSANSWLLRDNKRDPFNVTAQMLIPNSSAAEYTDTTLIDFVSNGFKLRHQNGLMNANGGTFIYLAFAESPFKYANAR